MDSSALYSDKVIASGKWLKFIERRYKDNEGRDRQWEFVSRTTRAEGARADASFIIPTLKRFMHIDCVVLVKQWRPPINALCLEFPAGLIDSTDASPMDCAARELLEETGYTMFGLPTNTPDVGTNSNARQVELPDKKAEKPAELLTNMDSRMSESGGFPPTTAPVNCRGGGEEGVRAPPAPVGPHVSRQPLSVSAGISDENAFIVACDVDGDDAANQCPRQRLDELESVEVVCLPVANLLHSLDEISSSGVVVDSRVYAYALGLEAATRK